MIGDQGIVQMMNAKKTSAFPHSAGINEKVSPVKVGLESPCLAMQ